MMPLLIVSLLRYALITLLRHCRHFRWLDLLFRCLPFTMPP